MALIGTISGSNGTSVSAVTGSLIIADRNSTDFPTKRSDAILFVSGVIGGRGTSGGGVAVVGGDMVVSGNAYFQNVDVSNVLTYLSGVAGEQKVTGNLIMSGTGIISSIDTILLTDGAGTIYVDASSSIYFADAWTSESISWPEPLGVRLSATGSEWDGYYALFGTSSLLAAISSSAGSGVSTLQGAYDHPAGQSIDVSSATGDLRFFSTLGDGHFLIGSGTDLRVTIDTSTQDYVQSSSNSHVIVTGVSDVDAGSFFEVSATGAFFRDSSYVTAGPANATLDVLGNVAWRFGSTIALVGTASDVDFAPFGPASIVPVTVASNSVLTGITGGVDGQLLLLVNTSANPLIINDNDSASVAANRIRTPGQITSISVAAYSSVLLTYSGSRWLITNNSGGTQTFLPSTTMDSTSILQHSSFALTSSISIPSLTSGYDGRTIFVANNAGSPINVTPPSGGAFTRTLSPGGGSTWMWYGSSWLCVGWC